MLDPALIIFVRKPELGKVKTRLAAEVGDEKALAIYKRLVDHTCAVSVAAHCDTFIFSTEKLDGEPWIAFQQELQCDGDLGNKMSNAFEHLFAKGYQKILIIGSDCPSLTTKHVDSAFEKLDD